MDTPTFLRKPADECSQQSPGDAAAVNKARAQKCMQKAYEAWISENMAKAVQWGMKAVALDPENDRAILSAMCCLNFRPDKEYSAYPDLLPVELSLMTVELANRYLALVSEPPDSRVFGYLGLALGRLARYEESVAALQKALLYPSKWEKDEMLLNMSLAMLFESRDEYENALDYIEKVLEANGSYDYAYFRQGMVHEKAGSAWKAYESYKEFLELAIVGNPYRKEEVAHARDYCGNVWGGR